MGSANSCLNQTFLFRGMVFRHLSAEQKCKKMKKVMFLIGVLGTASVLAGATLPSVLSKNNDKKEIKSNGCGYRIVEFGVGINCNGDTVKLERAKGFQHVTTVKKNDSSIAV